MIDLFPLDEVHKRSRPYFFWDYDLSEEEVRAILAGDDEHRKAWVISRILNAARWEDIWKYVTPEDIRAHFELLRFRTPYLRGLWAHALEVWAKAQEGGEAEALRSRGAEVREELAAYVADPIPELRPGILTPLQEEFLRRFFGHDVGRAFFLTGGTALAAFYLYHRISEDVDLFTVEEGELDAAEDVVLTLGDETGWEIHHRRLSPHFLRVDLTTAKGEFLRVELVQDVGPQFGEKRWCEGVLVDALPNIAANKVTAILGRGDVKDFVDLYFIIQRWGYDFDVLLEMGKQKDKGLTEFYLAGMMRQVRRVKDLPVMLEPVDLEALASFYDELADRLLARHRPPGQGSVE